MSKYKFTDCTYLVKNVEKVRSAMKMYQIMIFFLTRIFLWDYVQIVACEKSLVRIEESVLLQVVFTGPLTCV